MVQKAFQVLTEFKFEIGAAVASSKALQGSVDNLTGSVDQAQFALSRLGVGLAAQIGFGPMSVASAFYNAISASEKFYQSQIKLANVMQSAGFFKGPQAFENAMSASRMNLEKISELSRQFSLPANELLNTTSLLAPVLLSKGLDDSGLSKSTDLARQFLKASPILGTDAFGSMNQLVGAVMGRVDMGGQFSQRLFADTKALAPFSGAGGTAAFNKLAPEKRLDLLTRALGEFADNTRAAESIANSFTGQMQALRDTLLGAFSILRPLGDALMKPILTVLSGLNKMLQTEGKAIIANFSTILTEMVGDPKGLIASLLQFRQINRDLSSTGSALAIGGILLGIGEAMKFLGITATFANPLVGVLGMSMAVFADALGRAFPFLAPVLGFMTKLGGFIGIILSISTAIWGWTATIAGLRTVLRGILGVVSAVARPFAFLMVLFQLLSRAAAIAQIDDALALPQIMVRLSESFVHLRRAVALILDPLFQMFDSIARAISPVFRMSFLLGHVATVMDTVTYFITMMIGAIEGLLQAVVKVYWNMASIFQTGNLNIGEGVIDAYQQGMQDIFEKVYGRIEAGDTSAVAAMTTNIGKVEINNQFKEQMEPDRIAFTLKEQLVKAAINPTAAGGRSLRGGLLAQ
jgi:hypothetical protein